MQFLDLEQVAAISPMFGMRPEVLEVFRQAAERQRLDFEAIAGRMPSTAMEQLRSQFVGLGDLATGSIDASGSALVTSFQDSLRAQLGAIDVAGSFNLDSMLQQALIEHLARNPSEMQSMDHGLFGELFAELLHRQVFSVTLTKKSSDGGVDIIAIEDALIPRRLPVQCKRHAANRKIRVSQIRELHGVLADDREASQAVMATTSWLTPDTQRWVDKHRYRLDKKDFDDIVQMLQAC